MFEGGKFLVPKKKITLYEIWYTSGLKFDYMETTEVYAVSKGTI